MFGVDPSSVDPSGVDSFAAYSCDDANDEEAYWSINKFGIWREYILESGLSFVMWWL